MVLNDEGHHCWRPLADGNRDVPNPGEAKELEEEEQEATVWVGGLDKLNNSNPQGPTSRVSRCAWICRRPPSISKEAAIRRVVRFRGWLVILVLSMQSRAAS